MRAIYLDMDGVVADFNLFVSNLLGRPIGWGVSDLSNEEWDKLTAVDHLYYQLPLIEESTKLVALAKSFNTRFHVEFLTAIPRDATMPDATPDKIKWAQKYFPGVKVNFGPYSRDKQKWCKPLDILVDDKPQNIDQWYAAGGIAIKHTDDFDATMKNLMKGIEATESMILGV